MSRLNEIFYEKPVLKEVGSDILCCKFLTSEGVDLLLTSAIYNDEWTSNHRDKEYFTQDLHFKTSLPDLFEIVNNQLEEYIYPLASEFWQIAEFTTKNLFAVRYTMDTQKSLPPHHDDSFITGSVKLNDTYEGAELVFPRKSFSNKDIEVGDLLLWPGNITHLHESTELISGKKYSLTIWTDECSELEKTF